ncbi:LamG domain-containing protein [Nonomuraea endophytica]|uniref:LamG domain-containing protein n=1 Tax=Nonomuraea endophytica TaxID=714136 RepID=UPI0037C9FD39
MRPASAATAAEEPVAATVGEALAKARKSGEPVELGTHRGESSELLVNPDGTFTSVQHLLPVRTRKNGAWAKIDTTLERRADGSIGPVAATVGLSLSPGGDGRLAFIERAGRALQLGWNGTLPEPTLEGDTALYAEVMPGVDLQVRADATGFSHVLVVKTREAAANPALAQVRYPVTGDGVSIKADENGKIVATDDTSGGTVFETPVPLMWDSSTQNATPQTPSEAPQTQPLAAEPGPEPSSEGTGEPTQESSAEPVSADPAAPAQASTADGPGDGARVAEMATAVADGQMVLTPDAALMSAPDTQFPVYIDPQTTTPLATEWAMTTSAFPTTTYYKFKGKDNEGMGYCHSSFTNCGSSHVKRLHYEFPVSAFAGKTIVDAEFQVKETHSSSCTRTPVELWWTDNFADKLDWDKQKESGWWRKQVASKNEANGWSSDCPASDVIFDQAAVKDTLVQALGEGQSWMAFGLRAGDEGDRLGWKRFSYKAALRVTYNTPPAQPSTSQMSTVPGGACVTSGTPIPVNQVPTLQAVLKDADTQDAGKVQGRFRLRWDGVDRWTSPLSNAQTSGTTFKQVLPATIGGAPIPQSKIIEWDAQAFDSVTNSTWSGRCRFMYDTTAPAAPTVTSTVCSVEGDPRCAVGQVASFTVDSTSTDVTGYKVWLNSDPATSYPVTSGAAKTFSITPTREGTSVLHVQAYDAASKFSADTGYTFAVAAGSNAVARWKLDEEPGATTLADDNPNGDASIPLTHNGQAVLGAHGVDGTAAKLAGDDGWLNTAGQVINTAANFSVSAWAYLESGAQHAAIITQDGNRMSGFSLSYRADNKKWGLLRIGQDSDTYTDSAWAYSAETAEIGRWTHLVGVFNSAAGKLQLYVNGRLSAETAAPAGFNATGPFLVGRGKWKGVLVDRWTGKVDDIHVFERLVSAEEIAGLYAVTAPVAARWKLNKSAPTRDDSVFGRNLTFGGNATVSDGGYTNPQALVLDGAGDYATTSGPVVRASESFTVAGWVQPTTKDGAVNATVFSQAGTAASGFTVRYNAPLKRWQVEVPSADSPTATLQAVEHPNYLTASTDNWDHLAVVYNAPEKKLSLYVRGELAETVSVRGNTVAFNAIGGLQLGRRLKSAGVYDEYFAGVIDDVWAFQGVAAADTIAQLAIGKQVATYAELGARMWLTFDAGDGSDLSGHGNDVSLGAGTSFAAPSTMDGSEAALLLNGQSDAAATRAAGVVDTNQSFSVSAWARRDTDTEHGMIVSQSGASNSGFRLGFRADTKQWLFGRTLNDSDSVIWTELRSSRQPAPGRDGWVHLAGVYDKAAGKLRFYVDGNLDAEAAFTTPWQATQELALGYGKLRGAPVDRWRGQVENVGLYQGVLSQHQITLLAYADD